MFGSKTDHLHRAYVIRQLFCDDFSTNLTISWINECIQHSIPLPRHHSIWGGPRENVSRAPLWVSMGLHTVSAG